MILHAWQLDTTLPSTMCRLTSVHIVAQEEVRGLLARLAPILDQVQQVKELPVDVAHRRHRRLKIHTQPSD